MCIVWPCTDSQLHVNLHTEIQVFIQVMRIFYLFRNARIDILSALVALSLAGWRLFLDGQSIFFPAVWTFFLVGWKCVSAGWTVFVLLLLVWFSFTFSLSLSFFFSVSVSFFSIEALSEWALTSNWRSINTCHKNVFSFGLLARLSNDVIITTTLKLLQL